MLGGPGLLAGLTRTRPPAVQVEVFRRQDAQRGTRVAQMLEGFITRKVVKQTVMTVVYGVTHYGGRLQIEKRLRELTDFPQVRQACSAWNMLVSLPFKSWMILLQTQPPSGRPSWSPRPLTACSGLGISRRLWECQAPSLPGSGPQLL